MHVAICSAFRNAGTYVDRYFYQVAGLRKRLARRGDALTLCLGEGDSTDHTRSCILRSMGAFDARIAYCDHGGPIYGNIVHPERFKQLAFVWSQIWDLIPPAADAVLFVESDLIWQPDQLLWLIDDLRFGAAIAPMVWLKRDGYPPGFFYDVWAFRKDGQHFSQRSPYYEGWRPDSEDTILVDSAGSCLAIDGTLARSLRWDDRLIVGMCEQIYALEGQVWLNTCAEVIHP